MSTSGIYVIRNSVTGRIYLGSSRNCERRFMEHRSRLNRGVHCNAKLQASWSKHTASSFAFEVIASVLNEADLEAIEQHFLDSFDCVKTGYNIAPTAGNTAGWRASEESRSRMSAAAKLRDHSIQVAAMAIATKGVKRPQYVVDAMQRGRRASPLNEASKLRMSNSAIARSRYSQDDRRRMSEMRDAGTTWRAIGAVFGVSHQPVAVYVKQWRQANADTR